MADGALVLINIRPYSGGLVLDEAAGPGNVVGVDVDHSGGGVDGGSAPFGSAIEAGKDHGLPAHAERNELAFAAEGAELLHGPGMRLGRASSEHIFGEKLPGEGLRLERQGLLG